jgi:pimeloyl-ACP methyl ester carboxylesterase
MDVNTITAADAVDAVRVFEVPRGPHRIHAEVVVGDGTPVVLMHGFPDNVHLYDRLMPHLAGRTTVRFDFLGWGRSNKPAGYPYTARNQVGDVSAVVDYLGLDRVVLVAHDASGPPAIDWALNHPDRVATLVLLNTYYDWFPGLRRPPAIALYSTPVIGTVARAVARLRPDWSRRLYLWQVGTFIQDEAARKELPLALFEQFVAAQPAFWRLNSDLLGTVFSRRLRVPAMRRFSRPVRIVFGARDRYLNPRVARRLHALFPVSDLTLLRSGGHYVQVDQPETVARLILEAPETVPGNPGYY